MEIIASRIRRLIREEISKVSRNKLNESESIPKLPAGTLAKASRSYHIRTAEKILDASLKDAKLLLKSGKRARGPMTRMRNAAEMWRRAWEELESGRLTLDRVANDLYFDIVDAYYDYENPTWDADNIYAGVGRELYKLIKYELQGAPWWSGMGEF